MGIVNNLVITRQGALLLNLLKVRKGTFTRLVIGEGYCYDDLTEVKSIITPVVSLNIKSYDEDNVNGIVTLKTDFDNTIADKDFWYRELGIMAKDDETGEEILYAYGNANELAEFIPKAQASKATIRKSLILPINVGNTDNITVIIDSSFDSYQIKAEKGKPDGYASLDEGGLVPKEQLPFLQSLPAFCFNSGPVDSDGNSALMTVENDILTLNAPAVGTTADGETFTVSENITLDISNLADGSYNCFYNPETGGLELYANEIFEQKAAPENWSINDIWVNTSIMPNVSYKKVSDTEKVVTKLVQTADIVRVSNGGGVTLSNKDYNYPNTKLISQVDKITGDITNIQDSVNGNLYINGNSWCIIYPNKWCEQGGRAYAPYTGAVVELLQEYKDMNFDGLVTNYGGNTSATINTAFTVQSPSKIVVASGFASSSLVTWRTWGQIA